MVEGKRFQCHRIVLQTSSAFFQVNEDGKKMIICLPGSVSDPFHFDMDPDPDPRIHFVK